MLKKVVIAAAGQGTRMKHLTRHKSKHLILVQKRPFLAYLFDELLKAGYEELIVVAGFKAEKVQEFLDKYQPPAGIAKNKVRTFLVNQFEILGPKEKEYGTLCPIKCVKKIIGEDNFLAVYGDNLYSVKDLQAMNIDDTYNYVAGFEHKHPEKYGVLLADNSFLKEIIEKPKDYVGSLINTGLYKFTPAIFKELPRVRLSPRGEYELTDAITFLAQKKKVKIKRLQDYWLDFGNPGDIIKLSKFLQQQRSDCC
jgi:dTDP-glucose pyrophosphorylase